MDAKARRKWATTAAVKALDYFNNVNREKGGVKKYTEQEIKLVADSILVAMKP